MKESPALVLTRKERIRLQKYVIKSFRPTKTERRLFNLHLLKAQAQKFFEWFWKPSDIVQMSDRRYQVMPNGEWRRHFNA